MIKRIFKTNVSLLNKASQQGSEEATNNLALYYFNQGKQDLEKATDKKNDKTDFAN